MSFLVNKLAEHAGDIVADKIRSALGGGDDDEDKDKDKDKKGKKGQKDNDSNFLSFFKGDKDEKEDDEDKDGDKKNFFERIFNRGDDDDDDDRERVSKRAGFAGLFSEQDQPGATMSEEGAPESSGSLDHMTDQDLDLMSDLMEVAKDTS